MGKGIGGFIMNSKYKQILTIDCDFFMKPCIQLYNDLIGSLPIHNHDAEWHNIFEKLNCEAFMSHDDDNLSFMLETIKGLNCPIYVGLDHHSILRAMDLVYRKDNTFSGPFDIVNNDHHHDIAYNSEQIRDLELFSFVSCGSWVGFLEKQKLLHNYYWVANENSKPFNFNLPIFPPYRENAVFVINKKDFKHNPENYSLCYISSSLDFIPPQEKETYFTFLRALIARYNDKISWIYDSYDNHFKMKMILDGLNKDKKATYEIATEHI